MFKTKVLITFLLVAISQMVMAQGRVISGTVEDAMGPVMMANVVERDANNRIISATQTDMMGNFSMEIKNPKNKLVVSYVGSKTLIVPIGDQSTFTLKLEDEKTTLSEVTVVSRRSNANGLNIPTKEMSVAQQTFNLSDVEGLAFTSVDEALQGEIAGLDIVSNSGNLGGGTTMRLRGVTTINGNATPLIVVDDKIFDNPDENFDFTTATEEEYSALLSVSPEDIATINVLKDGAACAVWGSDGANGVILITTKRGSRGKPRVNFQYKFSGTWQQKGYDLLNGDNYSMLLKEEFYNPAQLSTATSYIREINYDKSWGDYENWNNNTDWVDAVTQFGAQHSYSLNVSGGGQKATFRISGTYDKQTGSIIKQSMDRLTTRLVLDYNVSDRIRFSTNFALTYTDYMKNYTQGSTLGPNAILAMAQNVAPNMAIYRQDAYGNETNDYYIMNPTGTRDHVNSPYSGNYSSYEMSAVRNIGNPVAYANQAWKEDKTYRIVPDFNLKYELLGLGSDQHRLTFNGDVNFDIYASSVPQFLPGSLRTDSYTITNYNMMNDSESNRTKIEAKADLTFTPYFKNEDFSWTMRGRYQMWTQKYSSQYIQQYEIPNGITSPTTDNALSSMSSSNSRSNGMSLSYSTHFAYKGRYMLDFSFRADTKSSFGPKNKWAYFPSVALRYNVSDEKFFEPIRKTVSMLGIRASWGRTANPPQGESIFYNSWNTSTAGSYGRGNQLYTVATLSGLKLDDLKVENTDAYNIGLNLGLFNDLIEIDAEYYYKNTKDLLQKNVGIPSTTGYSSVAYANIGRMTNTGWEMNVSAKKFIKIGKFSMDASFNMYQNFNEIKEMDKRVLDAINSDWIASSRGTFQNRIQVGNPLGSIYGFKYKGVYSYSYEYLQNYNTEMIRSGAWKRGDGNYEAWINQQLADGVTFPVAVGADGKVIMTSANEPKHLVYNYEDGSSTYTFQGGDAIYEDINHDGQINSLDIVYLGNSQPKFQGGFNLTFRYGQWQLKARFNFRTGSKIINTARMNLERMYDTSNQASSVTYRWRKDGDGMDGASIMPRAMYNAAYNWQGSDRYVEDGSFLRLNNLQVSYSFPKKMVKNLGLNQLQIYGSMNNLFCWTKYSGIDPEKGSGSWGVTYDNGQTPMSKSFTATISVGF